MEADQDRVCRGLRLHLTFTGIPFRLSAPTHPTTNRLRPWPVLRLLGFLIPCQVPRLPILSRNSSFEIDSMEFYLSRGRLQGRKDLAPKKRRSGRSVLQVGHSLIALLAAVLPPERITVTIFVSSFNCELVFDTASRGAPLGRHDHTLGRTNEGGNFRSGSCLRIAFLLADDSWSARFSAAARFVTWEMDRIPAIMRVGEAPALRLRGCAKRRNRIAAHSYVQRRVAQSLSPAFATGFAK